MAVALSALEASVLVEEPDGPRSIPINDLYRLPGNEPERDTNLGRGALITAVEVPALSFGRRSAYRKVRDRASYAFAVASVAAALDVSDGVVRDVRLALGAVAPRPWRAVKAEHALRLQPATEAAFRNAIDTELADTRPLRDNAFKVPLVRNLVTRILCDLAGMAS
jgi:xanthine dehydrogenase YagS FAD-binding subunit